MPEEGAFLWPPTSSVSGESRTGCNPKTAVQTETFSTILLLRSDCLDAECACAEGLPREQTTMLGMAGSLGSSWMLCEATALDLLITTDRVQVGTMSLWKVVKLFDANPHLQFHDLQDFHRAL